ncbi:MAG: hypothetical protein K2X36_05070, partial [Microbacteriaceae bacterium]|nr:hypothetical protein [Microbacteriaceae bacterium]
STGILTASGGAAADNVGKVTIQAGLSGTGTVNTGNITGIGAQSGNLYINGPQTYTGGQINYDGRIQIDMTGNIVVTGLEATNAAGQGGNIIVRSTGGNVTVNTNGIMSFSNGAGNSSGEVTVLATNGAVSITGGINASMANGATGNSIAIAGGSVILPTGDINSSVTTTTGDGSDVTIVANGNISVNNVIASGGSTSGSGGRIYMHGGNSGTGNITALNLTSTGNNGSDGVRIIAPGIVSLGNLNSSSSSSAGGFITVQAGTSGTSRAPAQSGMLTIGTINATGASGGYVRINNLGTNGGITTSDITANATLNGAGCSGISIVAHGTVTTGNISATSNGGGSYGGSAFISSGATSGTAISTGFIDLDGNTRGDTWLIRNAGASNSTGTITDGTTFNGVPTAPIANIVGTTTITVRPGTVTGYNPGGFDSVNAPAGTLTINTDNADGARVLIAVRGGDVSLSALISDNNGAGNGIQIGSAGDVNITTSVSGVPALTHMQVVSSAGSISLPTISDNNMIAGIAAYSSQGFTLSNGNSLTLSNGFAGRTLAIRVAWGGINLGSANNQTNNTINVSD